MATVVARCNTLSNATYGDTTLTQRAQVMGDLIVVVLLAGEKGDHKNVLF